MSDFILATFGAFTVTFILIVGLAAWHTRRRKRMRFALLDPTTYLFSQVRRLTRMHKRRRSTGQQF
jgi:hypothetical protein